MSAHHYAAFVWPTYILTAVAFAWMILDTVLRARRWRKRVEALEKADKS